jgi:hypothetical protein
MKPRASPSAGAPPLAPGLTRAGSSNSWAEAFCPSGLKASKGGVEAGRALLAGRWTLSDGLVAMGARLVFPAFWSRAVDTPFILGLAGPKLLASNGLCPSLSCLKSFQPRTNAGAGRQIDFGDGTPFRNAAERNISDGIHAGDVWVSRELLFQYW